MAIKELHKKRPRGRTPKRKNPVLATQRLERFDDNLIEVKPTRHRAGGWATVTYQQELVLCGKPKCRKWHGPYWYAYWTTGSRTRTLYIGKALRPAREVLAERQKTKA
jgi:hypothetical protein